MKKILVVLLLTMKLASASVTYVCEARIPKGHAVIVIDENLTEGAPIDFTFSSTQYFTGTLAVTWKEGEYFQAMGNVLAYENHPGVIVTLNGSFVKNDDDLVYLTLSARKDRRIDLGFGNPLACKEQ